MSGAGETHFGYAQVKVEAKQGLVDDVFHKVAGRYDLMNDLMSGGLHRLWKNDLVSHIQPPKAGDFAHLDVAGGTGDVAFRILDRIRAERGARGQRKVTVLDINGDMLRVGQERALKRFGEESRIEFVQANAESLPFPDRTYDSVTIAFGIRNVPRIPVALKEFHRVLKTGGRFLCLEFAPVDTPGLDRIYDAFSFNIIPPMGRMITGDAQPYQYLVESIRKFPVPAAFAGMIEAAGFRRVTHRPLSGGIVNIHSGWKL
ncbi:MAG: bifunctional demethylmenaquinone methyltransferase/2-methoxy-6-polyprenyl-1,4-benzoquinol methylase UbiE [Beijerinckiaceae bacterium]